MWSLSETKDGLSSADQILGPADRIKREWMKKAISKMKISKTADPSGVVGEM